MLMIFRHYLLLDYALFSQMLQNFASFNSGFSFKSDTLLMLLTLQGVVVKKSMHTAPAFYCPLICFFSLTSVLYIFLVFLVTIYVFLLEENGVTYA